MVVDTQRSRGFKHSQHQQAFTLRKRVELSRTMTSLLIVYIIQHVGLPLGGTLAIYGLP